MLGASAAMALSGLPFQGPIGAARVGYKDGNYLLNPTETELETSDLDLVVAGTKDAVLMVESDAKMLSEPVMLGAVMLGQEQMQAAIQAVTAYAAQAVKAHTGSTTCRVQQLQYGHISVSAPSTTTKNRTPP